MTDKCLHCAVMATVRSWVKEHGEVKDGVAVFDIVSIIESLSQCTVEVGQLAPERSQRRRAQRFAHDALDAFLKSKLNGNSTVSVNIPTEH